MSLLHKVEHNIERFGLFPLRSRVLIAVSGGVDSMVLLEVLRRFASLEIAHFNHQLRGEASDADERFVRETAQKLAIPFHSAHGDVAGFAREHSLSIEMAGRDLRHRFLAETATGLGISYIALAHHADDQVETFWLRLLRGDVGAGFTGMRWNRRSPADARIHLVRPLLNIPKSEIAAYAQSNGLVFREDLSNRDPAYQRNRLRQELLPPLAKFQPQLLEITLRAAEVLSTEKQFLSECATAWLQSKNENFGAIHVALQREVVREQLLSLGVRPDFHLIEQLRLSPNERVNAKRGINLVRNQNGLIELVSSQNTDFLETETSLALSSAGRVSWGNLQIDWDFVSARGSLQPNVEYFDAAAIGIHVRLRHWHPGDRYQPIGATQPIKLQDVFTNLKIPAAARRHRTVAVAQSGEIFWVEGLRIADAFKVTPSSVQVLKWTWAQTTPGST